MAVATLAPSGSSFPGQDATMPVASMPRMRGKGTLGDKPWRVKSSDRLSPKALMLMRTWPALGVGIGRCSSLRTSGPPGVWMTAAFIVDMAATLKCRKEIDSWCFVLGRGFELSKIGAQLRCLFMEELDDRLEMEMKILNI